jgi:hypothetical protein
MLKDWWFVWVWLTALGLFWVTDESRITVAMAKIESQEHTSAKL